MPLDLAFDLAHTLNPRVCERYGETRATAMASASRELCAQWLHRRAYRRFARPPNAPSKRWILDGVFGTPVRPIRLTEGV